jgi:hypothetical protein
MMVYVDYMGNFNPSIVTDDETLTRYVFHRNDIKGGRVKTGAFMPPRNLRLSVSRIDELSEENIWDIGRNVGNVSGRQLHGRADIRALKVMKIGLQINPDNTPERHANIIGWPEQESEQLSIAQELANFATPFIAP